VQYDRFFEQILDDHQKTWRRRRPRPGTGNSAAGDDLVDVLLQLAEEGEDRPELEANRLTRDGVKASV
jgi:hypothetical protein